MHRFTHCVLISCQVPPFTTCKGNATQTAARADVATLLCRQEASLCQGVRMLLRSSACVCQHYMARQGKALPMYWSPFAWLVLVTECVQGRRNRIKGSAWELAAVAPSDDGSAHGVDIHECFTDHEQDDSEWNLVQVCLSAKLSTVQV